MNKNSKVAYHIIIPQRVLQTLWNLVPCVQYGILTDTYADLFSILPTPFAIGLTQCIVFQVHGFEAFCRTSSFSLLTPNASSGCGTICWYYVYLRVNGGASLANFSCHHALCHLSIQSHDHHLCPSPSQDQSPYPYHYDAHYQKSAPQEQFHL